MDDVHAALTNQGANLYGASLAYRPMPTCSRRFELEYMPTVLPGISPIFYGLRVEVEGKSYQVRATSTLGRTFGLFDCTGSRPVCSKVATLRGGYGTTGMRVVFSLPLDEIGLQEGGKLKDVEAYSALGSYLSGASKILDSVRIKNQGAAEQRSGASVDLGTRRREALATTHTPPPPLGRERASAWPLTSKNALVDATGGAAQNAARCADRQPRALLASGGGLQSLRERIAGGDTNRGAVSPL